MSPLWSISLEEQFYVLWPNVIRQRPTGSNLGFVAGMLLAISTTSRFFLALYSDKPVFWSNTFTRLDAIAFGVLICVAIRKRSFSLNSPVHRVVVIASGIVLWAAVADRWKLNEDNLTFAGAIFGYPLVAIGAVLIFLGIWGVSYRNTALVYLGKISYGLYVFHSFVLYFVFRSFGTLVRHTGGFLLYVLASFFVTIVISAVSYRYFESPFLRLKERFTRVPSRPV